MTTVNELIEQINNLKQWEQRQLNVIDALNKSIETMTMHLELGTKPEINRLEVIDENGRSYTNMNVKSVKFSLQDDNRTLKIFL